MELSLTVSELQRYSRHLTLKEIGIKGQEKLKASKVLVIGAGGLGCPVLQYLAAAGVGEIGIVDFDTVDLANLQRQILFRVDDCGKKKAEVAARTLSRLNPEISLKPFAERFCSANALALVTQFDLIIDGTDNFATRYLINDACVVAGKPFASGSISRFQGQVGIFNFMDGPTYRCLFPAPPAPEDSPGCSEAGVLGVLPGIIGTLQASEALKIILGIGSPLSGKVLLVDALSAQTRVLTVKRNEEIVSKTEILPEEEYKNFCSRSSAMSKVPEITVKELKAKLDGGEALTLIDVREEDERLIASLGGELVPMQTVMQNLSKIPKTGTVVVYCRSGGRSMRVCETLASQHGYTNLVNLKGGTLAWSDEVDPSLPKY